MAPSWGAIFTIYSVKLDISYTNYAAIWGWDAILNLVKQAKQGNQEAFEELLVLNEKLLKSRIWVYWLPYGDRDDVAQEVYVAFYGAIMSFSEKRGASFENFAKVVIDRRLKTAIRKSRAHKHENLNNASSLNNVNEHGAELINLIVDSRYDNEIELIDNQFSIDTILKDCKLSKLEERIFKLHFIEDKTYEEIQIILNCKSRTVDNALQRSKRKIRNYYENIGGYREETTDRIQTIR